MYDFAVVGVGPAGARFARQVADAGYSVIGFERGSVGTPLACSGHVSTDIWDFLPESAPGSLRQNRIFGARFHAGVQIQMHICSTLVMKSQMSSIVSNLTAPSPDVPLLQEQRFANITR